MRWTKEEETKLRSLCEGVDVLLWAQILPHFPGRTDRGVKGKWHNELKYAAKGASSQAATSGSADVPNAPPRVGESDTSNDVQSPNSNHQNSQPSSVFFSPTPLPPVISTGNAEPNLPASLRDRFPFASAHYTHTSAPANTPQRIKPDGDGYAGKWTQHEDELLTQICGGGVRHQWNVIAQQFPGRSAKGIETRWYKALKDKPAAEALRHSVQDLATEAAREIRRASNYQCGEPQFIRWTTDEDALLRSLVARTGDGVRVSWIYIVSHFPTRTRSAVQSRWRHLEADDGSTESEENYSNPTGNDELQRPLAPVTSKRPALLLPAPLRAANKFAALAHAAKRPRWSPSPPVSSRDVDEDESGPHHTDSSPEEPPSSPRRHADRPLCVAATPVQRRPERFRRAVSEPLFSVTCKVSCDI